ncbi:MAG: DUF433 domain-containing protein [Acidobacteria bacterium]|nr:DUF433 domain-containing protein [Acidobacteriota bacterium]
MAVATINPHIALNELGKPVVRGTRHKVIHIAKEMTGKGLSAQEMQTEFPHLTIADIEAAMEYYYEHKEELDADFDRGIARAEKLLRRIGPSELAIKARQMRGRK